MPEVPKIVRERLRASESVQNHPDPDLLTAFAEKSLPERERANVLNHLARCGDCREVVALALPASEVVQEQVPHGRTSWLTWPALRWGLAAAGVVIVASLGIVQYQRTSSPQSLAKFSAKPEPPRTEAKAEVPASPTFTQDNERGYASNAVAPPANAPAPLPKLVTPAEGKRDDTVRRVPSGVTDTVGGTLVSGGPRSTFKQQVAGQATATEQTPQMFDRLQRSAVPPSPTSSQSLEGRAATPQIGTGQGGGIGSGGGAGAGIQSKQVEYSKAKEPVPPAAAPSMVVNQAQDEWALLKNGVRALPGQMGGYVVDPSGAAVGNAQITLPPPYGGSATTFPDSQGHWLIAGLPSGNYQARAEAQGFSTTSRAFNYDASRPSLYVFPLNLGTASETVEVAAQSPALQAETATVTDKVSGAQVAQMPASGRSFTSLTTLARWTISSSGALQRSLDQGKTWQDVNVFANAGPVANFTSLDANAAVIVQGDEKDAHTKSLKRQAIRPLAFRAVTANGLEVWAGGSNASLFHSSDGGNRWTRILPSSGTTILTGDVIGLEFSDPQHGTVTTSTAEVWTTADAGQTWHKN